MVGKLVAKDMIQSSEINEIVVTELSWAPTNLFSCSYFWNHALLSVHSNCLLNVGITAISHFLFFPEFSRL